MSDDSDISGMDEDRVLAAEYALGLLSAEERARAAARLAAEPALRADLRFWLSRLSSLDGEFAETAPPASAWAGIERQLFAGAPGQGRWWDSLALWRSFAGAAAAIAIVAVGLNVMAPRPDPNAFAAQLVAALSAQGSNVQVVALYNATSGEVRLTALSGDKVPDKDYQLWAIEGDAAPKSLGLIKIDARNDVKLPADVLAQFGPGTTLAISLEPLGGSPKATPTGPVVAAGKATAI
jgi:anti-sigma-K factor RskA